MSSQDVSDALGWERKPRGIFEGPDWAESLAKAKITPKDWDERFSFAIHNISVQPLQNTTAFTTEAHRLIQVSLPNELIGWVYFRIEPDDENCTLLWIEAKRFTRLG
jgi:hypothetical protein